MDHSGMDMDEGTSCKVSMLWNWYTIDACFLASSWHIRNRGMFAASCIGVALLSATLEGVRRLARDYDSQLHRQWRNRAAHQSSMVAGIERVEPTTVTFRASPLQQTIRAVLHATMFGLAYIVMLLVMYFNGYIIISVIVGAGMGKFFCDWTSTTIVLGSPAKTGTKQQACIEEATVCCG